MYDFDIFSFKLSLAGIAAGAAILAKVLFASRKIKVKCAGVVRM